MDSPPFPEPAHTALVGMTTREQIIPCLTRTRFIPMIFAVSEDAQCAQRYREDLIMHKEETAFSLTRLLGIHPRHIPAQKHVTRPNNLRKPVHFRHEIDFTLMLFFPLPGVETADLGTAGTKPKRCTQASQRDL